MEGGRFNNNTRAVLEAVQAMDHHPTVYEIYHEVQRSRPGVGLATVYRAARRLVEMRLIKDLDGGHSGSRYDARTERHDHALCTSCGALLDLPVEITISAEAARLAAEAAGLQMFSHEVRLYGRCKSCATSAAVQYPCAEAEKNE